MITTKTIKSYEFTVEEVEQILVQYLEDKFHENIETEPDLQVNCHKNNEIAGYTMSWEVK